MRDHALKATEELKRSRNDGDNKVENILEILQILSRTFTLKSHEKKFIGAGNSRNFF